MNNKAPLTHFIGMNGLHGCLPDSCSAYETKQAAAESLRELLELSDEQYNELVTDDIVRALDVEQGAEYAEIQQCSCLTPWDHCETDTPDNWSDYVLCHVQEFLGTLDKQTYNERIIEHNPEQCRCSSNDSFYCRAWVTKTFYLLPYASFGDYDNSSAVERSNSRVFNELPFVSLRHGDYYSVQTGIDEDDIDAISWDDLESLKDTCNSLSDYPVLDEDNMNQMEMELQDEAWENCYKSDFQGELVKFFGDEHEDLIEDLDDETLLELFRNACDASNTYWEIESGGNAYIDLERVVKAVELDFPSDDEDEDDETTEPDEDAITTTDYRHFYQYGKIVLTLSEEEEHVNKAIKSYLDKEEFWPDVYIISDHGNAHLIEYWKED